VKTIQIVAGLFCATSLMAQEFDSAVRGVFFDKAIHTPSPLPVFSDCRGRLPRPVIDANPEWLPLYWRAWELAFAHLKTPQPGSPFLSNYIDEAFSSNIFQWDTIFMMSFMRYAHAVFPAIESLDNFYGRQHDSGYICREIREADGADFYYQGVDNTINPPLFAWAEVEWYQLSGDASRFSSVIPVLAQYAAWIERYRVLSGTSHGLFWNTGLGSGMDNTPRLGSGWVDLSAQMVLMYDNLSFLCHKAGMSREARQYRRRAGEIASAINALMWNENDGIYYDIDDDGTQVPCKTIAGFWPLLAGIPTPLQAQRMSATLKDSLQFWRTIPFPSLFAGHPLYAADGQYWLGGVWAPTNYMVIRGLQEYDQSDLAGEAAERYLDGISRVFQQTGTIWENYSPEHYAHGNPAKPDFVGWSGCGPIAMLIEQIIGVRADAGGKRIIWHLRRTDRHGVENLMVGDNQVSLICEKRKRPTERAWITVTATAPITVEFHHPLGIKTIRVKPGERQVAVPE